MQPAAAEDLPLGRVVRLHFCCRAELPIGSSLRVTGSTLWAPTHLTAQDPTNAHHISVQETTEAIPTSPIDPLGDEEQIASSEESSFSFTSSVELVTTPDQYPLWKTRRPVVVVLHKKSTPLQHHYYRYMVVTPGADGTSEQQVLMDDDNPSTNLGGTTSNEFLEISSVMAWEDPFLENEESESLHRSTASMVSVLSMGAEKKRNLASLPYRTLDISTVTGKIVIAESGEEDIEDGIIRRLDTWNNPDDVSFRPYLIREAVRTNG